MTAPDPDAGSYRAFLRILSCRDLMSVVDINRLRDDLTAAQISPAMRGGCFKAAAQAGFLSPCGATTANTPESRGRLVRTYLLVRRPELVAAA